MQENKDMRSHYTKTLLIVAGAVALTILAGGFVATVCLKKKCPCIIEEGEQKKTSDACECS